MNLAMGGREQVEIVEKWTQQAKRGIKPSRLPGLEDPGEAGLAQY
jgi:hypothetical protein